MRQTEKNVSPMSNEGRNAYVIEHITDALLKLLREKPIEDISISELCELAGIGRASFYRNFNSKEDILRTYIQGLFQEWTAAGAQGENRPLSEFLHLLKDGIIALCGPQMEHSKEEAYTRAYVAYTLYGWIEVWFQRGMQETAEEIAEMFQKHKL